MAGKVTVVLDAQAGSCGKGKVIGFLAKRGGQHVAIDNFMSNAGHTFVDDDGVPMMTQHLPTSMVDDRMVLCIGPGSAITLDILIDEIRKYRDIINNRRIFIHPRAMVINQSHCESERRLIKSGSTMKGCGFAQADKIIRTPGIKLMRDLYSELPDDVKEVVCIEDTASMVNHAIDMDLNVIVEGSQGFDLDINYGLDYPHTTSRQCHAGQLVADCGISPRLVTDIIMVMRPYPIRISSTAVTGEQLSSGDYDGSKEITWDEVKRRCGAPDDVEFGEMTTVTKKVRRVFEFNYNRLIYATHINRPTGIVINFAQYIDWDVLGATNINQLTDKVWKFIEMVTRSTGVPVIMVGTGAKNNEMVVL